MSDAPEETSERSTRQLLKGAAGFETQVTSSTLVPFSLSQVPLPTEEESDPFSDLSDVVPPWCLKGLEGDHERMLRRVDEYERIARDAPVEPYTDPILRRKNRQYLRLVRKLDRLHILRLHPQERVASSQKQ